MAYVKKKRNDDDNAIRESNWLYRIESNSMWDPCVPVISGCLIPNMASAKPTETPLYIVEKNKAR